MSGCERLRKPANLYSVSSRILGSLVPLFVTAVEFRYRTLRTYNNTAVPVQ
jgi:hypothetical protein